MFFLPINQVVMFNINSDLFDGANQPRQSKEATTEGKVEGSGTEATVIYPLQTAIPHPLASS